MIVNDNFIHYYFTSILISLLGFTGVFALNTLLFWHDRSEVTLAAFLKIPPSCESIRSLAHGVSNFLLKGERQIADSTAARMATNARRSVRAKVPAAIAEVKTI